jgi:hypothetical protein
VAHFNLPINPNGVLVALYVGVSAPRAHALRVAGQAIPSPMLVQGLIDTGASGVCIDSTIIQQLSIPARGSGTMLTPSAGYVPQPTPIYDISLKIPHAGTSLNYETIPATESLLVNQGFHVLIGRDILSGWLIVYDGLLGTCTVAI